MEGLRTTTKINGRKTAYITEFSKPGSLKKIIDFLKTNQSPTNPGTEGIVVISVKIEDGLIKRTMTAPLPDNSTVKTFIGSSPIYVTYEIAYNENMLVSKAVNPESIGSFFKFTEILTIEEENGILKFSREASVFNAGKQIPLIGSSYQDYDDYFNNHNLAYYWGLSEIAF